MNADFLVLAGRIRQETAELVTVIARAERAYRVARQGGQDSDLYVDATALNLHDFYSGLERIFRQIATTVDHSTPAGPEWHRDLLSQMCADIPTIRPAVLTRGTCDALDEFMRFRHVVRNVYAFQLDGTRIERLVRDGSSLIEQIAVELEAFSSFLERTGQA